MEPSPQLSRIRKALQRYKCWICVTSYLENADLVALTDSVGISCANLEANCDCPVMTTLAHRNKLDALRNIAYVDGLILPRSEHHRPLSPRQQSRLWVGTMALVYYSGQIGWGMESTAAIPKASLLFPYYGEFISSKEAKLRYLENKTQKRMNFILTVREHIPATADTSEGVLISNVDAARAGSVARFVNHSCDPNTTIVMLREQGEVLGIPVLRALRAIGGGEQITFHYGGGDAVGNNTAAGRVGAVKVGRATDSDTLLGKRSSHEGGCGVEDATGVEARKHCYCGAASCTGFLPYSAFDD